MTEFSKNPQSESELDPTLKIDLNSLTHDDIRKIRKILSGEDYPELFVTPEERDSIEHIDIYLKFWEDQEED